MRLAVLDLGSQTFHATIADVDAIGVRRVVFDRKIAARIGEHAFADRRIPDATYARGLDLVGELVDRTRARGAERLRVVATGVFRDADNGAAFVAEASARSGVAIELLDGATEASLTWLGVSAELAGSHGRLAVVDLGGGSLELACGSHGVEVARSLPLGALRLRDVAATSIPGAVAALAAPAIDDVLAHDPESVVLASGTARALLGLARRLALVGVIQRHVCTRTFGELARRIVPLSGDALAAFGVPAPRRDTIAAGAIAIAAVLVRMGRPVVYVARGGLREGALVDLARAKRGLTAEASALAS